MLAQILFTFSISHPSINSLRYQVSDAAEINNIAWSKLFYVVLNSLRCNTPIAPLACYIQGLRGQTVFQNQAQIQFAIFHLHPYCWITQNFPPHYFHPEKLNFHSLTLSWWICTCVCLCIHVLLYTCTLYVFMCIICICVTYFCIPLVSLP